MRKDQVRPIGCRQQTTFAVRNAMVAGEHDIVARCIGQPASSAYRDCLEG